MTHLWFPTEVMEVFVIIAGMYTGEGGRFWKHLYWHHTRENIAYRVEDRCVPLGFFISRALAAVLVRSIYQGLK